MYTFTLSEYNGIYSIYYQPFNAFWSDIIPRRKVTRYLSIHLDKRLTTLDFTNPDTFSNPISLKFQNSKNSYVSIVQSQQIWNLYSNSH